MTLELDAARLRCTWRTGCSSSRLNPSRLRVRPNSSKMNSFSTRASTEMMSSWRNSSMSAVVWMLRAVPPRKGGEG